MGLVKHKMMEEENNPFEGSGELAISGGFLDVKVDGKTICTVSIPIPNFMAGRYNESVSEWTEEFDDFDGNTYVATVYSSMHGVDWEVDVKSNDNGLKPSNELLSDISSRINIEINYTEEV